MSENPFLAPVPKSSPAIQSFDDDDFDRDSRPWGIYALAIVYALLGFATLAVAVLLYANPGALGAAGESGSEAGVLYLILAAVSIAMAYGMWIGNGWTWSIVNYLCASRILSHGWIIISAFVWPETIADSNITMSTVFTEHALRFTGFALLLGYCLKGNVRSFFGTRYMGVPYALAVYFGLALVVRIATTVL